MKTLIALVAATAVFAFAAAGTASARPAAKSPTLAQFNALSKKVTKLQKQAKTLQLEIDILATYAFCLTAATADAFQGTWIFTNKGTTTPVFPATSTGGAAVNDLQACSAFRIPRQLPSPDTAPTTGVFAALIGLFT